MSSKCSASSQRIIGFCWLIVISISHLATSALATITHTEYAVTTYYVEHISYQWEIKNFTLIPKNNGCITSLKFNSSNEHHWFFTLCTPLTNNDNKKTRFTTLKVEAYSGVANMIEKMSGKMSIFTSERQIGHLAFQDKLVGSGDKIYKGVMSRADRGLRSLKPDMSITVQFEIDIPLSRTKIVGPNNRIMKVFGSYEQVSNHSQRSPLKSDLHKLLNEKKFADVEITVGDQTFLAHKAILASRSSIFLAQLENGKVNNYGRVTLAMENIKVDVMEAVLEYIYTDEIVNLNEFASIEELLAAASALELPHLLIMCGNLLKEELTTDNAETLLSIAERYNAEDLRKYVWNFLNDDILDHENT